MSIDVLLTEEQIDIRETVRSFVTRELHPLEPMLIEREARGGPGVPTRDETNELRSKAQASGLWGIETPEEHGGVDLGAVAQSMVYEELGRAIFDFRFGGSAPPALLSATDEQKTSYLFPVINGEREYCLAMSEPNAGSDALNLSTTARQLGGDWVINGEKAWISKGLWADFAIVFARTVVGDADRGITAFLVDREMGWTSSPVPLMGAHQVASIHFDDVVVPADNVLGEVGCGLSPFLSTINPSRGYKISARNVGAAKRLLEVGAEYARSRVTFGRPLAERGAIQSLVAESEVEIRSAELLVHHAARRSEAGYTFSTEAAAAKLEAARTANNVVDRVLQIHGAVGLAKGLIIERYYRDLRVERIYEGADEIQLRTIARSVLK